MGESEATEIRLNFGRPMAFFPLPVAMLMPHAVRGIHIFEPRYRQMVRDALDGPGQIAMAVFRGEGWKADYHGRPPVRPAVCVGQIVQHQQLEDGRYNLLLHGVCRARIIEELDPEPEVLYRRAMMEPLGLDPNDEDELGHIRARLRERLADRPLADLRDAPSVVKHIDDPEIPTAAILELVTCSVLADSDLRYYGELHYQLLAEPDVRLRAKMIDVQLDDLARLIRRAERQRSSGDEPAPKGCTWN